MIVDYTQTVWMTTNKGVFSIPYSDMEELIQGKTDKLNVKPDECLYVGDGGSRELYAARDAGMHPIQCTWFHDRAYEPHIPCPILDEFDHADHQSEILDLCKD